MNTNAANIKTLLRKSTSPLLIALLKEQIASIQAIDTLNRSNVLDLTPRHEVKKVDAWAEAINILSFRYAHIKLHITLQQERSVPASRAQDTN